MNALLFLHSKFQVKELRIKLRFMNVFQVLQVKDLRKFEYIWITLQAFPTILLYWYLIKKSVKGKKNYCFSSLVRGEMLVTQDLRIFCILRDCGKKTIDKTTNIAGKNMKFLKFLFYI